MSDIHKTRAWAKLSKAHKQLSCVDCGATTDIQSGHILAASRFKMSRLWMWNLKHQCRACNLKQGTKLQFNLITIQLLMVYGMIKGIGIFLQLLATAFFITLLYKDISAGGIETSFSGQIIIETWESLNQLKEAL